jgi:uncharacterized protein
VIFVGSNVPMNRVAGAHARTVGAERVLQHAVSGCERLVTHTEVLQEILHRYVAIERRDAIQPAFDALPGVVDEVFSIDLGAVDRAKAMVFGNRRLSARDALHVEVMEREGVQRIMSFDRGSTTCPGSSG